MRRELRRDSCDHLGGEREHANEDMLRFIEEVCERGSVPLGIINELNLHTVRSDLSHPPIVRMTSSANIFPQPIDVLGVAHTTSMLRPGTRTSAIHSC